MDVSESVAARIDEKLAIAVGGRMDAAGVAPKKDGQVKAAPRRAEKKWPLPILARKRKRLRRIDEKLAVAPAVKRVAVAGDWT